MYRAATPTTYASSEQVNLPRIGPSPAHRFHLDRNVQFFRDLHHPIAEAQMGDHRGIEKGDERPPSEARFAAFFAAGAVFGDPHVEHKGDVRLHRMGRRDRPPEPHLLLDRRPAITVLG